MLEEQKEFLNTRNREGLNRIFGAKRVGGKLKIEIGTQELKILYLEKKKTRNNKDMMVVKLGKSPVIFDQLRTKVSYATIDCFHMLQSECSCEFNDNWYKQFTVCLDESSFAAIRKGDTFLCLVQHTERLFEKDGEIITYEKGERFGDDIVLIQPQIIGIYPLGSKVEFSYLDLYKKLKR